VVLDAIGLRRYWPLPSDEVGRCTHADGADRAPTVGPRVAIGAETNSIRMILVDLGRGQRAKFGPRGTRDDRFDADLAGVGEILLDLLARSGR